MMALDDEIRVMADAKTKKQTNDNLARMIRNGRDDDMAGYMKRSYWIFP